MGSDVAGTLSDVGAKWGFQKQPQLQAVPTPPPTQSQAPNPVNSADQLDAAAAQQRRAKGSAATKLYNNASGPMNSGGGMSARMLLGS